VVVATFEEPVVTCGEWQQGWTTLIWSLADLETFYYPYHNNFSSLNVTKALF